MDKSKILPLNPLTHRLHKVVYQMDKIADQVLQNNLELTFSQFRILLVLDWKSNVSQATIAKYHGLTAAAISRQIDILAAKKLITIKPNAKNRREHLLLLSSSGKAILHKASGHINKVFGQIYGELSSSEKETALKALDKLSNFISAKGILYFCPKPRA